MACGLSGSSALATSGDPSTERGVASVQTRFKLGCVRSEPTPPMLFRFLCRTVWLLALCPLLIPAADETSLLPIGSGAFAVASTNVEITAPTAQPLLDYLKGKGTSRQSFYVSDLLVEPSAALLVQHEVPNRPQVYRRLAGQRLPLLMYVFYPTPPDNPRPNYTFPYTETGDNVFPHMQRAGERPLFAAPATRYPLILYSHGFEGHGLWEVEHAKVLAAHGYLVAVLFHGDGRAGIVSGIGLRPLQQRAALDYLLAHPDFGSAIDPERIGMWGGSYGAYGVLAALGGQVPELPAPPADPRIKAGVGLVPFMGATFGQWPLNIESWPFGKDYAGLQAVEKPFLALYAEKDVNVLPAGVEAGVRQLSGPVVAVQLAGEQHLVSKSAWPDIHTWEVLFFNAWLRGDVEARRMLEAAQAVTAGVPDRKTFQRAGRSAP